MLVAFVEATNESNYGKFEITIPTAEEYARRSVVDPTSRQSLYGRLGWSRLWFKLFDLETGIGAYFHHGSNAQADLEKARIRVCFVFPIFLEWLYAHPMGDDPEGWIDSLPEHVHLPETVDAMQLILAQKNASSTRTTTALGAAPGLKELTP